ncbi:MAG: FAD-dependent oxidoreductase [Abditibacteriales bacterium]|nr:FAD-dependent oxidoreductase [Abditibacteriales bacterium]MDW8365363.1 FAD-dependent oxidoreductase [Abditibacteriales bacterium]
MSSSKSVLIIGGGVVGLCVAYYAMQKGHRVTIVERGAPDHDCCSLGNAGLIVPSHFIPLAAPGMVALGLRMMFNPESPFYVRPRLDADLLRWGWQFCRAASVRHVQRSAPLLRDLLCASRRCFEELAQQWGNDFGFVQKGALMLCKTEQALEEEAKTAEMARALDVPAEVLTAEQVAQREPNVRMNIAGAVYFPLDCHLIPQQFMARLTRALEEGGATFCWSTEVTGWCVSGQRIAAVQTQRGELSADEFVLAAGAWSPQVARSLGIRLPMQAGKGYSLTLPNPKQKPTIPCLLTEARVAVTPMGNALRFGGTMEIAGLDTAINPARVRGILKSIPLYFPEFGPGDFRDVPTWCGLRPCSPDGLPYVGRFRRYANLCAATGHAMLGVSLGPITGQLVAAILSDEPPSVGLDMLSPERYT